MLDNVARFAGQRLAAVVAETEGAAEAGCRALEIVYEILPAVFDADDAMKPGAPVVHAEPEALRLSDARHNIFLEIHGENGDVERGFADADAIYEETFESSRQQHAHLETHQSIAWPSDDGRIHIRTSSQGPFISKGKLCYLFGMMPEKLHLFTERVGGGFGGKQEMITEDLPLLAVLKLGRPVQWEFTREEEFTGASARHPMKIHVKLGAKRDGTLTAIQFRVVNNTGAYGNHAGEVLANSMGGAWAVYRCPNKKGDGYAVYTNTVPGGGFRGYGSTQAIVCNGIVDRRTRAARRNGPDGVPPQERRARRRSDGIGLERSHRSRDGQLRPRSVHGFRRRRDRERPRFAKARRANDWLEGKGFAINMLDCVPPTEFRSGATVALLEDGTYRVAVGSSEFGNGIVTAQAQIAAQVLGCTTASVKVANADTDTTPYDSGTFGSVGTMVPTLAVAFSATALRDLIIAYASSISGVPKGDCRVGDGTVTCGSQTIPLAELRARGTAEGRRFDAFRKAFNTPRTVAFNVHGFRLAVHRITGEIVILQSVQGVDCGVVMNPLQMRGQVDGGVAQGIGWALSEKIVYDAAGKIVNPSLRDYRIPMMSDTPVTETFFADTYDRFGPLGAKSNAEATINPIVPAIANALADATGVRFPTMPFSEDRIFAKLQEAASVTA